MRHQARKTPGQRLGLAELDELVRRGAFTGNELQRQRRAVHDRLSRKRGFCAQAPRHPPRGGLHQVPDHDHDGHDDDDQARHVDDDHDRLGRNHDDTKPAGTVTTTTAGSSTTTTTAKTTTTTAG